MKKLSTAEIEHILDNKLIGECTPEEKRQVMNYAFGEEFMESPDEEKGTLKEYKN
jgi:hypothetical protein